MRHRRGPSRRGVAQTPPVPAGAGADDRLIQVILASTLSGPLKRSLVAQVVRLRESPEEDCPQEAKPPDDESAGPAPWIFGLIVGVLGGVLIAVVALAFTTRCNRKRHCPTLLSFLGGAALAVLATLAFIQARSEYRARAHRD